VLRDQVLLGLTWASIGYSQWRLLDLVQLASAGRVHLVSLVVLVANAGIAAAILRWRAGAPWPARLRPLARAAGVVAASAGLGHVMRERRNAASGEGPVAVGLQPNISQADRSRLKAFDTLRVHHGLIREFRARHPRVRPDLLVYSETSFPGTREPEVTLPDFLKRVVVGASSNGPEGVLHVRDLVLPEPGQVTILGLVRGKRLPDAERGGPRDDDGDGFDEVNVAWVVENGVPTDVAYAKRGLAPFGEFTPVPRGLPGRGLVKKLIRGALGYVPGLNPGSSAVLFDVPFRGGKARGGLTICFEMAFPWYFRESARLGADFHVNISNDAWFDGSSELELVDAAGIFRAVETGRSLFRVSNSGISTLIGPDGTRLAVVEAPSGRRTQVRGALLGRIPLNRGSTGYVLLGDLPWILPALVLLGALMAATIRAKRFLPDDSVR
jgi:apolipoprotein N-acyltransferase